MNGHPSNREEDLVFVALCDRFLSTTNIRRTMTRQELQQATGLDAEVLEETLKGLRGPDAPPALRPATFVLSWVDDEPPIPESEDDRRVYLLAPILIEELVRAIYRVAGRDLSRGGSRHRSGPPQVTSSAAERPLVHTSSPPGRLV